MGTRTLGVDPMPNCPLNVDFCGLISFDDVDGPPMELRRPIVIDLFWLW